MGLNYSPSPKKICFSDPEDNQWDDRISHMARDYKDLPKNMYENTPKDFDVIKKIYPR